jgi:hypothetical protein
VGESVAISQSQGESFTWATGSFNWSAYTADKPWSGATRTQHQIAVAASVALTERKLSTLAKHTSRSIGLSDARSLQVSKAWREGVAFAQSYADIIAFVLRILETARFASDALRSVSLLWNQVLSNHEAASRQVRKPMDESLAFSETQRAQTTKALLSAVGLGDAWSQSGEKHWAEPWAIAPLSQRETIKPFASTWATSSSLHRDVVTRVIEAVLLAAVFGRGWQLALAEAWLMASATSSNMLKVLEDGIDIAEAVRRNVGQRLSENMGLVEVAAREAQKHFFDAFDSRDAVHQSVFKHFAYDVAMAEVLSRDGVKAVDDAWRLDASASKWLNKLSLEAFDLADAQRVDVLKQVLEVLGMSETYTDLIAFVLSVSEGLAWGDQASRHTSKAWTELFGIPDAVHKDSIACPNELLHTRDAWSQRFEQALNDALGLASSTGKSADKLLMETVLVNDHMHRACTAHWLQAFTLDEGLAKQVSVLLDDALAVDSSSYRSLSKNAFEGLLATDGLGRALTKRLAEAWATADAYADLIAYVLRFTESMALSDVQRKAITQVLTQDLHLDEQRASQIDMRYAHAFAVADVLGRAVSYRRALNEGWSTSDALTRSIDMRFAQALDVAEQYRRSPNGVISDMIVGSRPLSESDFADLVDAGHPPGFTNFRDFIAGDYSYQKALFRAVLTSSNADRGYIKDLSLAVDVPDVLDRGSAQISDANVGVSVAFSRAFRVPPEVTLTHKGGSMMAIPRILGAVNTQGFTAVLEDLSGARVTGTVSWVAQGY